MSVTKNGARMVLKPIVLLGLLPHFIAASVTCNYSSSAEEGDTCQNFAESWDISVDDLKALNPGIECPRLSAGQELCVLGTSSSADPTTAQASIKPTTTTLQKQPSPTKTGDKPSPVQPGIASDCDGYHLVSTNDQCQAIEKKYGITSDEFIRWNPAVNESPSINPPAPFPAICCKGQ